MVIDDIFDIDKAIEMCVGINNHLKSAIDIASGSIHFLNEEYSYLKVMSAKLNDYIDLINGLKNELALNKEIK